MTDEKMFAVRLDELKEIFTPKQLMAIEEVFRIMEDKYPAYSKEDIISISIETILKNVDIPVDKIKEQMCKEVKKDLQCFSEELESLEDLKSDLKYLPELESNKVRRAVLKETSKVMAESYEEYEKNVFVLTRYVTGMPLTTIASLANLTIDEVKDIISDEKSLAQLRATIGSMIVEEEATAFVDMGKEYLRQAVDTHTNLEVIKQAVYEDYPRIVR